MFPLHLFLFISLFRFLFSSSVKSKIEVHNLYMKHTKFHEPYYCDKGHNFFTKIMFLDSDENNSDYCNIEHDKFITGSLFN